MLVLGCPHGSTQGGSWAKARRARRERRVTYCRLRRPISDLHLIPCASGAAEGGAGVGVGGVWGGGLGAGSAWAGDAPIQSHHLAVNCYDNILRVYQRMVGPHTGMAADGTLHSMSGGNGSSAVTGAVDTNAPSAPSAPSCMPSILDLPEILSSTPSFHLQVSLPASSLPVPARARSLPLLARAWRVRQG